MQIAADTVVSIDYTLTDPQGQVLDSSQGREPLAYLHGHGNIIPGLEKALAGKASGEALKVTIPAAEGYGVRDERLIQTMGKQSFQGVEQLQVGMQFRAQSPQGMHIVTITKIEGDKVTVDGNHPLAGVDLTFDVKVVEVRAATQDEIGHGHVHGAGGHHHH